MNIKSQVRAVSELLCYVAASSDLASVFVTNEDAIVEACLKQAKLEGIATRTGANFGSFTLAKTLNSVVFTKEEKSLITALWAVKIAGDKVTGFKF